MMKMNFVIEQTTDENVLDRCALLMSESEPWTTLQRDLAACKTAMRGAYKEVYVSVLDGELCGFVVLQMAGVFTGYIQSLCVSPKNRNAGVGTALVDFAEKRIFSVSPNVFLLVSTFNKDAARLYLRIGYEKIGVLKNFVRDGSDEYLLRKTIGSLNSFQDKIQAA